MKKDELKNIYSEVIFLKKKIGLKIIDTHIHPHDVMGIVPYRAGRASDDFKINFETPGLLEILEFNLFEKILAKIYFKSYPRGVISHIESVYNLEESKLISKEMDFALIDEGVFLPIEPWTSFEKLINKYGNNPRYKILGSIDLNTLSKDEIKERIKILYYDYNIIGLKLHPNLQNFYPSPGRNSVDVRDKLRAIYDTAEELGIYIIFHGGLSNYTSYVHPCYRKNFRSRHKGKLKYFFEESARGESELFSRKKLKIIIAHLGHYGIVSPDYRLLSLVSKKYKNVFFDISKISPRRISKAINILGNKRIIFGSDGMYNRLAYCVAIAYKGILFSNLKESEFEKTVENIFYKNFEEITKRK